MSLITLYGLLILMLVIAAFFSAAETAIMSINRYRLRHLALVKKNRAAQRVKKLLEQPERFLGMVLIGNTCANIFASSIMTVISLRTFDETSIAVMTGLLTLIILVLCEIAPKTLAAAHNERISFLVSLPILWMLKLFLPLIWLINFITNMILRMCGLAVLPAHTEHVSADELRSIVHDAGSKIPRKYQNMLLAVLDLNTISVNDIMVPRNEIIGINIDDDWETIADCLQHTHHTRIPIYNSELNNILGILHIRDTLPLLTSNKLTKEALIELMQVAHFVPVGTSLNSQLQQFQKNQCRTGLVVDEYGEIQGLVTLEDILEEIVGEFTTDTASSNKDTAMQADGSFVIDGSIPLQKLNRLLGLKFSTSGPKTLSGLIIEHLQTLPHSGVCLKIGNYQLEILSIDNNKVKKVRLNM